MDMTIILVVLAGVLAATNAYVLRLKNVAELEHLVKEEAYKLFLYAEKQNWIGKEKMAFAAQEIYRRIDNKLLKLVLKEETVVLYLQNLYEQFKSNLAKEVEQNE